MNNLRASWARFRGMFLPDAARYQDLADELESHIQLHADEYIRGGFCRRRRRGDEAILALGGVESTQGVRHQGLARRAAGSSPSSAISRDVRAHAPAQPGVSPYGHRHSRTWHRRELGVFTVVNAVVLRPLPLRCDADRIVRLWHTPPQSTFPGIAAPSRCRQRTSGTGRGQSQSFEAMAIYRGGRPSLTGHGEPIAVQSIRASARLHTHLRLAANRGSRVHRR